MILFILIILLLLLCMIFKRRINFTFQGGKHIKKADYVGTTPSTWNSPWNKKFIQLVKDAINTTAIHPFITTNDIKHEVQYKENSGLVKSCCHRGQRKLFLTELQFMNTYPEAKNILYVGAAPSRKSGLFSMLLPNIKVILCDGNDFNIAMTDKKGYLEQNFMHRVNFVKSQSMYGAHKDIVWLHDGYHFQDWEKGDNIVNVYNPNTDTIEQHDRRDKLMNSWDITIYDILDKPDIIDKYRNILLNSNFKIFIISGYFTNPLARIFAKIYNKNDIYFWSDIRTVVEEGSMGWDAGETGAPTDTDIIWNTSQNYNWIRLMNPKAYMLKYRIPFYNGAKLDKYKHIIGEDLEFSKKMYGIDFEENYYNKIFEWVGGEVYIQPFAPISSTECRLVGNTIPENYRVNHNQQEHENKMFYFNNVIREFVWCKNPYINEQNKADHSMDSLMEVKIWEDYKRLHNPSFNIDEGIRMLNNVGGICEPRKEKNTWERYRKKLVNKFPWMDDKIPKNIMTTGGESKREILLLKKCIEQGCFNPNNIMTTGGGSNKLLFVINKTGHTTDSIPIVFTFKTPTDIANGLMYRKEPLPYNSAALFVFPEPTYINFWMKNTYIPLDFVYLDSDFKVVQVYKNNIPMDEQWKPSNTKIKYALELNAGTIDTMDINIGYTLRQLI